MKILICSRYFAPQNTIGAVRPTMFAKYLSQFGHEVAVITDKLGKDNAQCGYLFKIFRVENKRMILSFKEKHSQKKEQNLNAEINQNKIEKKILELRRFTIGSILEFLWYKRVRSYVNREMRNEHYDIVFSSYGPLSSFYIGRYIYRKKIADYWVSDMRDLMINNFTPKVYYPIFRYYLKQMQKESAKVTVVSKGQKYVLEQMFKTNFWGDKIVVLYNGFDVFSDTNVLHDDVLRIVYTGTLYKDKRDMRMLLRAIYELFRDDKVDLNNIELHYAGDDGGEFIKQVSEYGLNKIAFNHGFLSKEESFALQTEGDILIVLTWNTDKDQGILTGKFLEYLSLRKNIIAVVSGNKSNAEITDLIDEMNVGVSCEVARSEYDYLKLKDYLYGLYSLKKQRRKITFSGNIDKIMQFSYPYIVKEVETVFKALVYNGTN